MTTLDSFRKKATTIFENFKTYETIAAKIEKLADEYGFDVEYSSTSHYTCNDTITVRTEGGGLVRRFDCSDKKIKHEF